MRPIDADALKIDMQEYFDNIPVYMPGVFHVIERAPTVESKVRHGQWIQQKSPNGECFNCSECGHEVTVPSSEMIDPRDCECYLDKYCGNCGAKMFQSGGFITKKRLIEIMTDGTHGDCWFFDAMEDGANDHIP